MYESIFTFFLTSTLYRPSTTGWYLLFSLTVEDVSKYKINLYSKYKIILSEYKIKYPKFKNYTCDSHIGSKVHLF